MSQNEDNSLSQEERKSYKWTNITKEFHELCQQLNVGELVHDVHFGLFEAMSAIEMMDPKMDAGMLCNQVKRKVYDFDEALKANIIKDDNLEKDELIGIFDSTYACIVTWLEGHSLAQTVFTNLYLHNPDAIKDKTLKSFCTTILKIVDLIRDRINKANVFEEEDFQSVSYGFKMANDVPSSKVISSLREVEDELAKKVRSTKDKGEDDDERAKQHELYTAIYSRIKFTRFLYATLLAFCKDKCSGVEDIEKYLTGIFDILSSMQSTINLGIKPEEKECGLHDYPTIIGFEPLVNQRLLPSTFPRYAKIMSIEETMNYLTQMCKRFKKITGVTKYSSLHQTMDFLEDFSKMSPCVLSRSLLHLLVFPINRRFFGNEPLVDVVRDTIRNFIAPPAIVPKSSIGNNSDAKACCDAFLQRAANTILQLVNISGQNRARQREKLAHIFEELANLESEADKLDTYLHGLLMKNSQEQTIVCFVTWVLYHVLKAMFNYLYLGFELELYSPQEYYYVYWYISELHCSWWIPTLTRADNFLMESEAMIETQSGKSAKKVRRQQKKKGKPHAKQVHMAQIHQLLCNAFLKALLGFIRAKKLELADESSIAFDSEEVRFRRRFAPFQVLSSPAPMAYVHFTDTIDLKRYKPVPEPEHLFQAACKGFQQAKMLIEQLPSNQSEQATALLKICKYNIVAMNVLSTGKKEYERPLFDFNVHKHYPILTLKN